MGTAKKSDGRYVVGVGVENANEYNGSMAYRDIVIQLTEDGATEDSVNKLEYLRDYAEYHASIGEPIVPHNVSIWISGNGFSKAVEADDINVTESGFEIGGITYDGESWDYSNAGQGSGSGSGGVFWVTIVEENSEFTSDKTAIEIYNAYQAGANVMAHCVHMEDDIQIDQNPAYLSLSKVEYEMDEGEEYCTAYFNAVEVDTSSVPPVMNYAKAYISSDPEVSYQSGAYTLTS